MAAPLIETVALAKRYRMGSETIEAVRDLDLTIMPGEFVAIMGPSGSGKSTCLNILGLLLSPSSGYCRFDGIEVASLTVDALAEIRNSKVGFVFQAFHLMPKATVCQNVELPLIYSAERPRARRIRAEAALKNVGLEHRLTHKPSQLSGGQMQRVAIARALVTNPKLILADEPTGSVDSRTGADIMTLLTRLNAEGHTIVLVTHDRDVACHAHRILTFRDGRVVADEHVP